jgi:hypothetical protein
VSGKKQNRVRSDGGAGGEQIEESVMWYAAKQMTDFELENCLMPMPQRLTLRELAEAVEEIPRTKGVTYRLVGTAEGVSQELFLPPERVPWSDLVKQVQIVPMLERRFQEIMKTVCDCADWRRLPEVLPEMIRSSLMRVPIEHTETAEWLKLMVSLNVNGTAISHIGEAQREYAAGERCWRVFGINNGDLMYAMESLEAAESCLGGKTQYARLNEFKEALRVWRAEAAERAGRR